MKFEADHDDSKETESEKRWIITESGYTVSFLISDKRLELDTLRSQILNTFGHVEDLEAEQIEIKIVDKACVLVHVTFHCQSSLAHVSGWTFWWKKGHTLRTHDFRKWRKRIEVEALYPIHFRYRAALCLLDDNVRQFVSGYLSNVEELLQKRDQIQFEAMDDGEWTQCAIYFANRRAREQLRRSKVIDLRQMVNVKEKVECELVVDTDSIVC